MRFGQRAPLRPLFDPPFEGYVRTPDSTIIAGARKDLGSSREEPLVVDCNAIRNTWARKDPTSALLRLSAGLGWSTISAVLRSHGVGETPVNARA